MMMAHTLAPREWRRTGCDKCNKSNTKPMSLIKSAANVGWLTAVSRSLGFIRDLLVANLLGTGLVAEAFFVALRFPNLFRAMFAEGAFDAAFVPLFAKTIEGDGFEAARVFASDIFSALTAWLVVLTAVAVVAMPLLMYVIAPGFAGDDTMFPLAIELTRVTFPYLLFMSLTALQSGVLNSLQRFGAAAAAPILLNLILIVVILAAVTMAWGDEPRTGRALAWGVLLAGVGQYLWLAVSCRRAGMVLLPHMPRFTSGVKRVIALSIPGVISAGITQVNLLLATILATGIARGVSYLYYADRLYQLPLGIVGVAIGVVLLPDMSRKLRGGLPQAANQRKSGPRTVVASYPASYSRVDGSRSADCAHAVRARRLHTSRRNRDRRCAHGICGGSSCIRSDQGPCSGLLCPGGHSNPDAIRRHQCHCEHCCGPRSIALFRPCRHCRRYGYRGLGERRSSGRHALATKTFRPRRPAARQAAAYYRCMRRYDDTAYNRTPLVYCSLRVKVPTACSRRRSSGADSRCMRRLFFSSQAFRAMDIGEFKGIFRWR